VSGEPIPTASAEPNPEYQGKLPLIDPEALSLVCDWHALAVKTVPREAKRGAATISEIHADGGQALFLATDVSKASDVCQKTTINNSLHSVELAGQKKPPMRSSGSVPTPPLT